SQQKERKAKSANTIPTAQTARRSGRCRGAMVTGGSFIRRRARFDFGGGCSGSGGAIRLGEKGAVEIHARTAAALPKIKARAAKPWSSPPPMIPRSRPAIVATLTRVSPAGRGFIYGEQATAPVARQ